MKTIEEKAKAYDDVVEKLSKLYRDYDSVSNLIDVKEELENILPELKESEDEKIRKALLNHLKEASRGKTLVVNTLDYKRWADWLEKQGKNNMGISEATKQKLEDNLNKALEKETPESWNEFLDEQKTVDKVESIFEVGNWIVNNQSKYTFLIKRGGSRFQAENTDGDIYSFYLLPNGEEEYHLWTIEDAKDGDVLVDEDNNIGIYKEIEGLCWHSYIYLGCDNRLYGFSNGGSHIQSNTKPATKEQRDTLMKAMADAKYTFDFDKKELRKLKFRVGDIVKSKSQPMLIPRKIISIGKDCYWCEDRGCIGFAWEDDCELVEQKPADTEKGAKENEKEIPNSAWSEEDEIALGDALWCCKKAVSLAKDENDMGNAWYAENWLKSLKDRVQPKQELSKEDERMFKNTIALIETLEDCNKAPDVFGDVKFWLKSLKERYNWKPSDEQMLALDSAIHCYAGISPTNNREVYALEIMKEQLKKLRGE